MKEKIKDDRDREKGRYLSLPKGIEYWSENYNHP
jgi:hypothetical protein